MLDCIIFSPHYIYRSINIVICIITTVLTRWIIAIIWGGVSCISLIINTIVVCVLTAPSLTWLLTLYFVLLSLPNGTSYMYIVPDAKPDGICTSKYWIRLLKSGSKNQIRLNLITQPMNIHAHSFKRPLWRLIKFLAHLMFYLYFWFLWRIFN